MACCQTPNTATGLNEYIDALLLGEQSRIKFVTLDLQDQESLEAAAITIGQEFGWIDVLLNVAGILGG